MIPRTPSDPQAPTLDWDAARREALAVKCRGTTYCRAQVGEDCVDPTGAPLVGQPAHALRRVDGAALAGRELAAPEPDDGPAAPLTRTGGPKRPHTCNYCSAALVWAKTRNDAWMPVDRDPSDRGNVRLRNEGTTVRADVIGKRTQADAMRAAGERLHLHHAVTCPFKHRWSTSAKGSSSG